MTEKFVSRLENRLSVEIYGWSEVNQKERRGVTNE
jgi:hypothetical protein